MAGTWLPQLLGCRACKFRLDLAHRPPELLQQPGERSPGPQVPHLMDNCPQGCHLRWPPPVEPLRGDCHPPPASRPCAKSRCARTHPWWSVGNTQEGQGSTKAPGAPVNRPRGNWPQRSTGPGAATERAGGWASPGRAQAVPGGRAQSGEWPRPAGAREGSSRAAEMHDRRTGEGVTAGSQAVARPWAAWRRGGEHSPEGRGSDQGL